MYELLDSYFIGVGLTEDEKQALFSTALILIIYCVPLFVVRRICCKKENWKDGVLALIHYFSMSWYYLEYMEDKHHPLTVLISVVLPYLIPLAIFFIYTRIKNGSERF